MRLWVIITNSVWLDASQSGVNRYRRSAQACIAVCDTHSLLVLRPKWLLLARQQAASTSPLAHLGRDCELARLPLPRWEDDEFVRLVWQCPRSLGGLRGAKLP